MTNIWVDGSADAGAIFTFVKQSADLYGVATVYSAIQTNTNYRPYGDAGYVVSLSALLYCTTITTSANIGSDGIYAKEFTVDPSNIPDGSYTAGEYTETCYRDIYVGDNESNTVDQSDEQVTFTVKVFDCSYDITAPSASSLISE